MSDLVLLHGLGSAATFWDNIRPTLAAGFTVHAVDLPGHGPGATTLSPDQAHPGRMAATVAAALRRQGVERPHLVGLSLGGWVALEMAARGDAASVVALAPAGLWRPGARIPRERLPLLERRALALAGPVLPLVTRLPVAKRLALAANVHRPERVSAAQFLAAARALAQARGYAACDRAAVKNRFEGGAGVQVPTVVAFGDADRVLPAATSRERSLAPPGARWVELEDCGHAMSWDQPAACVALIAATARGAQPPEAS